MSSFFSVVDKEKNSLDNLNIKGLMDYQRDQQLKKMRKGWIGFLLDYEKIF
jgi:hypothetical protein